MAVFMIISIGGYGILDAAGAFDGVKESLGGNTIVLEGYGGLSRYTRIYAWFCI